MNWKPYIWLMLKPLLFTSALLLSLALSSCKDEIFNNSCVNASDPYMVIADTLVYNKERHYVNPLIVTLGSQDTSYFYDVDRDYKNDFKIEHFTVDTGGYFYDYTLLYNLNSKIKFAVVPGYPKALTENDIGTVMNDSLSWAYEDTLPIKLVNVWPDTSFTYTWNESDTTNNYAMFRKDFCSGYKYGWIKILHSQAFGPSTIQK